MLALALALLLPTAAETPRPVSGVAPTAKPEFKLTVAKAWEAPLDAIPLGAPRLVPGAAGAATALLRLPARVEARNVADGSLAWARADLAGAGLADCPPAPTPLGPALAWTGTLPAGPRLLLLAPSDGRTLAEIPLEAAPAGPPTPVGDADGTVWYVPLAEGKVAVLGPEGKNGGWFSLGREIEPPFAAVAGHALALVRPSMEMIVVGAPSAKPLARGVVPGTVVAAGARVFFGADRAVAALRHRQGKAEPVGKEVWRQRLGGAITAPPLPLADRVLAASWDTNVYAFRAVNGHELWRTSIGSRVEAPLALFKERFVLALAAGSATIRLLDAEKGSLVGKIEGAPDDVFLAGAAADGDLVVVPALAAPAQTTVLRGYKATLVKNAD